MGRSDELWAEGRMPVRCGLFRPDGTGREADCDGADLTRFAPGEPLAPGAADSETFTNNCGNTLTFDPASPEFSG
ncbi:hypothetical protein GCM10009759_13200 [Kitasatospora saccharophila]|uniref:Uncharacterized protein n=1 Tax=Kitasatospora saccharophila TaxID=407973 RepID=A0ABN2WGH2_9ACTN